jgi:hypothetical protein
VYEFPTGEPWYDKEGEQNEEVARPGEKLPSLAGQVVDGPEATSCS